MNLGANIDIVLSDIIVTLVVIFAIFLVWLGVKVVPQSEVYVVERFGKFMRRLDAGLNFIVPFLDRVAHKVSILERQLADKRVSVITSDNVEINLQTTVFYRIIAAERTVYRIQDIDRALATTATSIIRSAGGNLELDQLQSSREEMNETITESLQDAAEVWGIEITRTEILDIIVDEETKSAQRQQLNSERERRAAIARAEGERRRVELESDAKLYEAEKEAEAQRVLADAEAYAKQVVADAEAYQTNVVAKAIADGGQPAVNYDVLKRQVEALGKVASADNAKTIILPTEIAGVIGGLETLLVGVKEGS